MSNSIDVVIMLSTYNGEKYIDKQLKSIYEQSYDGEILLYVRDDGSTDNTVDIIESWGKRLNILWLKDDERLGAAKSFWKLFLSSPKSKYYAFVDQDDIWNVDKLSTAIQVLQNEPGKTLWFSNCRIIDNLDNVIKDQMNHQAPFLDVCSQMVCGIAQGCAMVFTEELAEYCKGCSIEHIPMHDTVILSYAFVVGRVFYEEQPFFDYRVHENNVVAKSGKSLLGKFRSTYSLWIKNKNEVSKLAEQIIRDNKRYMCEEDISFLVALSKTPNSLVNRWIVLQSPRVRTIYAKGLRSFRIRTLLGLI